jgi:hypothetical protein
MSRYIKKFATVGAIGPTEERGFALWVGYDIEGVSRDLSHAGLTIVDDWSEEELLKHGVRTFAFVAANDTETLRKLGIE